MAKINNPEEYIRKVRRHNISPVYLSEVREVFYHPEFFEPKVYKNNSRYSHLRRLYDSERAKYVHENPRQQYIRLSDEDEYYTITEQEENRLDIVSNMFYDTPKYWWVVALANYLFDPFDVPKGTTLRIPPIVSLYTQGGVLGG